MRRLRSLRAHRYNTRELRAGDVFEALPRDAKILVGLRRAEYFVDEPAPQPQPKPEPAPKPSAEGRSELYRMKKAELAEHLRDAGEDVDEDSSTREDLLRRALQLR